MARPSFGKNEDIEALRAIAIGLVLLCHLGELLKARGALNTFLLQFADFWGGVDIFFCVSGFVIAGTLLRSDRPDSFRQLAVPFYVRRIFRIWPAAFLWLAVAVLAAKFANHSGSFGQVRADLTDGIAAVLQVHNIYLDLCNTGQLTHCGKEVIYWTLSLEEQFYLLLPMLLYFVGPQRLRWLLVISIAVQFPLDRDSPSLLRYLRTDALAYGVLIAIATQSGPLPALSRCVKQRPLVASLVAVLLIAVVGVCSISHDLTINVGLIAMASAGLVLLASCNCNLIVARGWVRSAFLRMGSRSFGIYLVHNPCFWATREIFYRIHGGAPSGNSIALAATGLGLTAVVAELSYRFVEAPIRAYGHEVAKSYAVPNGPPQSGSRELVTSP